MEELALKRIFKEEKIILPETNGRLNIKKSAGLFNVCLDCKFKYLNSNTHEKSSRETVLEVYELKKDCTFKEMFNSFERNLKQLYLTQHQIVMFYQKHKEFLHPKWLTLFLFKENEKFFVASVHLKSGVTHVLVDHFEDFIVWSASYRHRLVVSAINF